MRVDAEVVRSSAECVARVAVVATAAVALEAEVRWRRSCDLWKLL